jgi:tripartite-type tricarboxylate transporter receptor subunit TctC
MEDDRVHSSRRRALVKAGAAVAGGAALGLPIFAAGQSAAASWPNRSVRIVVPYGAGGTADIMSRIIGQQLSKQLGQPFVIENKGGASTTIGAADVARSPADGYTLIVVTPTFAVAQFVYPNLPFAAKDFTPVALFITTPLLLVVNPSLGFKTVGDYIKFAKANPGKITFASSGAGSTPHLGFELLMEQAGINLLHIPYKGGGEAVASVLSGTTDSYFSVPIESGPHIKAGKMVALGGSGLKRAPSFPEVPTIAESGLPGFEMLHYTSMLVRSGTPPDILAKLSENVVKAMQAPDVREKFVENGEIALGTLTEASELYAKEYKRWPSVVQKAGIKPT